MRGIDGGEGVELLAGIGNGDLSAREIVQNAADSTGQTVFAEQSAGQFARAVRIFADRQRIAAHFYGVLKRPRHFERQNGGAERRLRQRGEQQGETQRGIGGVGRIGKIRQTRDGVCAGMDRGL